MEEVVAYYDRRQTILLLFFSFQNDFGLDPLPNEEVRTLYLHI